MCQFNKVIWKTAEVMSDTHILNWC